MSVRLGLVLLLAVFAQASYDDPVPVKDQQFLTRSSVSRIINGQDAARRQFPYQVGMFMDKKSFCGGSVISDFWILTAAHCVANIELHTVFFGALQMNLPYEAGRIALNTRTSYAHENYNPRGLDNDVGLVKMPVKIKLNQNVAIVPLPPRSFDKRDFVGKRVRVSGWGKLSDESRWISDKLQFVDLTVIENSECAKHYGATITDKIVCAAGDNSKSTCNGDSGGPLVIIDAKTNKTTHFGVVSFVHRNGCASGTPSGYDRTYKFLDWIHEKTKIPIQN